MQVKHATTPGRPSFGRCCRRWTGRGLVLLCLLPVLWMLVIAVRTGRTLRDYPQPQALFVLGGNLARVRYALGKAAEMPHLHVVISSGISERAAHYLAGQAGIDPARLVIDQQAVDTLTNFTRMLMPLRQRGIRHVYLVTSDYHMRRARAVAAIVFASRGIVTSPLPVASKRTHEPWQHALRDGLRALLWLVSGWDGKLETHGNQFPHARPVS